MTTEANSLLNDGPSSPFPRVVAMSFLDPSANYILRAIHAEQPLHKVIKIRWVDQRRRGKKKGKGNPIRRLADRSIRAIERRLYYNHYYKKQSETLDSMLSERDQFPSLEKPIEIDMNCINTCQTADLIKSLEPDVLLVCGAPMLKPKIFNIARMATINIHYGIAPDYRGEATLFWPLYFGDYQRIGLTVHRIDDGVDTGPMLTQVFLSFEHGDNETRLLAKASKAAPGPLIEILREAAFDGPTSSGAKTTGTNFRMRDRRIWHDLRVNLKSLRPLRSLTNAHEKSVHHRKHDETPVPESSVRQ